MPGDHIYTSSIASKQFTVGFETPQDSEKFTVRIIMCAIANLNVSLLPFLFQISPAIGS